MQPLRFTYSVEDCPSAVVTRPSADGDGGGEQQLEALLIFSDGIVRTLLGANGRSGLELGPPQQLTETPLWGATYDSYSDAVFVSFDAAVGQLMASSLEVKLVAGHPDEEGAVDGPGPDARLPSLSFLCSDGGGCLYGASDGDDQRVVQLRLPASWRARGAGAGGAAASPADAATEQAVVTILPFWLPDQVCGLAYAPNDGGSDGGGLIVSTRTALYRFPLGGGGAVEETSAPVLWAGDEEGRGMVDGSDPEARLNCLFGVCADAEGAVLAADQEENGTTAVRHVAPDGTVTTLARVTELCHTPFILPNGYLSLCVPAGVSSRSVLVLDLGLKPPPLGPSAAGAPTAGPPRRTLHADMRALLDAQPDGTADLTLLVAGRPFPVHRAILIARSDYFKRRLAAETFADGAAAELSLPDTDPAAFELLLRFLYTGAADIPPALAPSVAELADRLLLPELCSDAQAVVLFSMSAGTVVGSLLWAERLGGSFSGLLSQLKAWYLEHHEEVLEAAPDSVMRLAERPSLMLDLMRGLKGGAKRKRAVA